MEKPLTPQEAIRLLDNVCSQVSGTRLDHLKIQSAIQTLREFVEDKSETEE